MASKVVGFFLACIRSIPVIFISSIILWSYYAYVVQLCLFTVESVAEKVLYLIFYHPIIILMVWSYWKVIFTRVSTTPNQFFLSATDLGLFEHEVDRTNRKELLDQVTKNLPVHCRLTSGEVRYCEKCKAVKPDRAHHCSICGKCILKMDHHCPWVNNCVCFSNYKFFLLFLAYALTYCLYVTGTSMQYFIQFFVYVGNRNASSTGLQGLHIVFLFIASVLFAVSVTTLFCYHCYLVACNKSTIETYQPPVFPTGPDKAAFNLGGRKNFIEIFGSDKRFWFLPVFTSIGDGVSFPLRHNHQASLSYQSMETATAISISETVQSTDDVNAYSAKLRDDDVDRLLGLQQQQ